MKRRVPDFGFHAVSFQRDNQRVLKVFFTHRGRRHEFLRREKTIASNYISFEDTQRQVTPNAPVSRYKVPYNSTYSVYRR